MRILINDRQKQISPLAVERASAKIEASFSKFSPHVVSVELFLEDVNGPRGGLDKKCQIVVKLRKMDAVVVSMKNAAISKAIARAISKAQRAAGRKIQRRLSRSLGPRADHSLVFQS